MQESPTGFDLKKLQAWSGIVFFVFVVLHLINTWLGALGPEVYNGVQQLLRVIYQFPPIEALVLAAGLVHIIVGLVRIKIEPKRELTLRARMHRYAGLFLALVIAGHVTAVRGPSMFLDIYPGFHGLAFSVDAVPMYFFPYYFLLAVAGFYHGLNGFSIAMSRVGGRFRISNHRIASFTAIAAVLSLATLLALAGTWHDLGNVYDNDFARLALEIIGESAP
ncbi:MAG: hypothetical protein AAF541_14450 [Pseudomonadota bacterium]